MTADYTPGGEIACIHFIYPNEKGNVKANPIAGGILGVPVPGGQYAVACNVGSKLPTHATSVTSATTCPLCKKSQAFIDAELASKSKSLGDSDADRAVAEAMAKG